LKKKNWLGNKLDDERFQREEEKKEGQGNTARVVGKGYSGENMGDGVWKVISEEITKRGKS